MYCYMSQDSSPPAIQFHVLTVVGNQVMALRATGGVVVSALARFVIIDLYEFNPGPQPHFEVT